MKGKNLYLHRIQEKMRSSLRAEVLPIIVSLLSFIPRPAEAEIEAGPEEIIMREVLIIGRVGRSGRAAVHTDAIEHAIVAGNWEAPKQGDRVTTGAGQTLEWERAEADENGAIRNRLLRGGYVCWTVPSQRERVMLLDASGHSMVYVNGEPRVGDLYSTGWTLIGVMLQPGTNEFLFNVNRGRLKAKLVAPKSEAMFNLRDLTTPDLITRHEADSPGGVIVINATNKTARDLHLAVKRPGGHETARKLPPILPLSIRKCVFYPGGMAPGQAGKAPFELELQHRKDGATQIIDRAQLDLAVREPQSLRKETFISQIDGSVQYYAMMPARRAEQSERPALYLTLHGASVEARGQAAAYAPKDEGHIIAPTNRRPYGFDWEDWGRLDAMEVLGLVQKKYGTHPSRTYLTGHSMGGHGAWHIGATYPDRFAAIGPSAGWISFWSYKRKQRDEMPSPIEEMFTRATIASDTLKLSPNYRHQGIYILHGEADDNVPAEQAETMIEHLEKFHRDIEYHIQPGAEHWWDAGVGPATDCVDWPPMFDFFSKHRIPERGQVRRLAFKTASPGVSASFHWASIEAQIHPMRISSIDLVCEPYGLTISGSTENVARLALDLSHLSPGKIRLDIDGQRLGRVPWPAQKNTLWLEREGNQWRIGEKPTAALKGPHRYGPFKNAFRNRMIFVYGTGGTEEEKRWTRAKARFDAEMFWYRGNGAIDVVPDVDFDADAEPDRNVILYGNAQTNRRWNALLLDSPVEIRRGEVRVGQRRETGDDLACLFVQPRPGSDKALVGVIGGTGPAGMRLTERLAYFVSGVGYPDLTILGPEMLAEGMRGVRAAGYFGLDWGVESGEIAWRDGP